MCAYIVPRLLCGGEARGAEIRLRFELRRGLRPQNRCRRRGASTVERNGGIDLIQTAGVKDKLIGRFDLIRSVTDQLGHDCRGGVAVQGAHACIAASIGADGVVKVAWTGKFNTKV